MVYLGSIYIPPGGSIYATPLTLQQVADRTEELTGVVASVYSDPDDIVKHTVEILGATEDLSMESLKHIRQLCEV